MAAGGWLNVLGERWMGRASAGRAAVGFGRDLAGDIVLARAFDSEERPLPAGDKLYLNSDELAVPGTWAISMLSSRRAACYESMTISPDGGLLIGSTILRDGSTNVFLAPTKLRPDGTLLKSCKTANHAYSTVVRGIAAEGSDGTVFASFLIQVASYNSPILIVNPAMSTMVFAAASKVNMDVKASGNSAVFASLTLNSTRLMAALSKIDSAGAWAWRQVIMQADVSGNDTIFCAVFIDAAGNVYGFGSAKGSTYVGAFMAKYSSSGTLTWQRRLTTSIYPTGNLVGSFGWALSSGDYFLACLTNPSSRNGTCVARFNSAGTVTWQKEFSDATGSAKFLAGATDGVGRTIVAMAVPNQSSGIVLASVSSSGALEWQYEIDTVEPLNPVGALQVVTLTADATSIYVNFCQIGIIMRLPVSGGFSGTWRDGDKQITLTFAASAVAFATSSYSAGTTTFTATFSNTSSASSIAIDTAQGKRPSTQKLLPSAGYSYPMVSYAQPKFFAANVGSSGSDRVRGIGRQKGVSQKALTFYPQALVNGRQGVLLGTFCTPLAGSQWIGEGGDAVLYIAESLANTAVNFTAGSPEVYVWRPSTGKKVGTLHQAHETRIGTPAVSQGIEKVTAVRFSPLPVFAQDGDILVVELWGQILNPALATGYSGSVYYDGATESTTDNATVADFAAMLQFAGNVHLKLGVDHVASATADSMQYEGAPIIDVAITEHNKASDPYWNEVIIAMHMDETWVDLKGSNTFRTETGRYSLPSFDTSTFVSGTASLQFTYNETVAISNTGFVFGTHDFTIEFWGMWLTASGTYNRTQHAYGIGSNEAIGGQAITLVYDDSANDYRLMFDAGYGFIGAHSAPLDTFHHIAFVRSGENFRIYLNGVLDISFRCNSADPVYWPSESFATSSLGLCFPSIGGGVKALDSEGLFVKSDFGGYIDDLRITLGVARYSADFTPAYRFVTIDEDMTDFAATRTLTQTPLVQAIATATDTVEGIKAGESFLDFVAQVTATEIIDTNIYGDDLAVASATAVVTGTLPTPVTLTETPANVSAETTANWPVRASRTESANSQDISTGTWVTPVYGHGTTTATASATAKDNITANILADCNALETLVANAVFGMAATETAGAVAEIAATITQFTEGSAIAEAVSVQDGLAVFALFTSESAVARAIVSPDNIKEAFVDEVVAALVEAIASQYGPQPLSQENLVALHRLATAYVMTHGAAEINLLSVSNEIVLQVSEQTVVCKVNVNE